MGIDNGSTGHGCLHPNACFSKVSRGCPKFLTRDVRPNDPQMSAGHPARKLSLWADFVSDTRAG